MTKHTRMVIIGTSGSGKTSLAKAIEQRFGHRHIELDAYHWGPGWTERSDPIVRAELETATDADRWVLDGNYSRFHDITWRKATTILWLDYSKPLVLSRVIRRTLQRVRSREYLWGTDNQETLAKSISKDSIVLWSYNTWRDNRDRYTLRSATSPYAASLTFVRLRHPRDTAAFVRGLQT